MSSPVRSSNLDLVRVLSACAVIYGHSYALNGVPEPGWAAGGVGYLRLKVFLVISGALIARSWIGDQHLFRYLARRALRILPGLAFVVLFCSYVLGPMVTSLPVAEYYAHPGVPTYLWNLRFFAVFSLPGTFTGNPVPHAVNGSLWSLPIEVLMYGVLPVVLWISKKLGSMKVGIWVAMLAASAWSIWWKVQPPTQTYVVYGTLVRQVCDMAPFFLIGALYATHGWHKKLSLEWALGSVLAVSYFQPVGAPLVGVAMLLILPYLVLALSFAPDADFKWMGRLGNYAYGLYLWGFPIQQVLILHWGGPMPPLLNFALALPLTLGMSVVSWHCVEKWFLRLRPDAKPTLAPAPATASPVETAPLASAEVQVGRGTGASS